MSKAILCLDFDGVIHSYTSGWKGADVIPDPPTTSAFAFIRSAAEHFDVQVYSSRSHQPGGVQAMRTWFGENDDAAVSVGKLISILDVVSFPDHKPSAMISIDDRSLLFDGTWPSIEELKSFKPWYKK